MLSGKLDHVAIEVTDLEAAEDFYERVLLLKKHPIPEEVKAQGISWYDLGEGRALHLVKSEGSRLFHKAHFGLRVDDLEAWRMHVAGTGTEMVAPKINVYNAERFFIRDPSGNRIELVKWMD